MHTALEFAHYIVNKCVDLDRPISNVELNALMYKIYRESLRKGKLFPDQFCVSGFGPYIPEVYYHFCGWGAMTIDDKEDDRYNTFTDDNVPNIVINNVKWFCENVKAWFELSRLVTQPGCAYDLTKRANPDYGEPFKNIVIPDDLIQVKG